MTMRPDLLQSRLSVEAQGIQLKFDRNQLFPELDLKGTYGYGGSGGQQYSDTFGQINDGSQPFYSYGAQLSLPLSNVKDHCNSQKSGSGQDRIFSLPTLFFSQQHVSLHHRDVRQREELHS